MAVKLLGDLSASGDATFNSEVNLASGGQIDWANGDARIREGLVTDYSLSLQTWTGSALTTKMFIASGGNVGIGTTSPTSTLDVSGIITARDASILRRHVASWNNADTHDIIYNGWTSDMGDYVYLKAQGNSTGDHGMMIVGDNVAYVGRSNVETGAANSGLDQTWATFKNGGVGIGTTTPLEKLHVVGKINSSNNIVSNATYTMFTGRSSRTVDDYGGLNKEYFKANLVTPGPNTTGESSAHGIADLRFQLANSAGNTGMSDIMTLRSGGNVGIGTTSPADKLVVVGNATIHSGANLGTLSVGRSSTQNIKIYVDDTNNTITAYQDSDGNSEHIFALDRQFDGTGANNFFIRKGGSNQLKLDTSGNLRLFSYGAGILKTDANGNVSLDTSTYATQTWVGEQNYASDSAISTAVASYLPLAGGTMTGTINIGSSTNNGAAIKLIKSTTAPEIRIQAGESGVSAFTIYNTATNPDAEQFFINNTLGVSHLGNKRGALKLESSSGVVLTLSGSSATFVGTVTATGGNSTNWNTAYGWGNHGSAGYLTTSSAASTYAPKASPALTGTPTAPTAGSSTNTTQIATTAFVQTAVSNLVDSAPGALNTLNELAAALGDDASFSTTITNSIATKLPLAGGTMTGTLVVPKVSLTNDTGNNVNSRVTVYESGSVSYGMMLWNANGTSGDWATMIYGPNQSNRRISFGKANSNFPGTKASVDELAWLDLDNGNYFTDGNIYPGGSTTKYVSTGRIDNWNTAYGWGDHASGGYLEDITPATPSVDSTAVVGETIEITFSESSTTGVDYYQVWSAVGSSTGSYGLIAHIPQEDVASTMTVIDATFSVSDTMYYRVYAVKSGVYSTAGTANRAFSAAALDVANMSVVNLNTAYYIQYEMPDSRFVDHVEIYMDAEAASGDLTRTGATLVYSGNNSSYMYKIGSNDLDKFHQFWVEVIES